jgi:hypothetical protein
MLKVGVTPRIVAIVAYRRTEQGFVREDYGRLSLLRNRIGAPLAEICQRVEFSMEQECRKAKPPGLR